MLIGWKGNTGIIWKMSLGNIEMGKDWKIGDKVILGGEPYQIVQMFPSGGAKIVAYGACGATYISRSALDQTLEHSQGDADLVHSSEVASR